MRKGAKYSNEFKKQCVQELNDSLENETIEEVAFRLKINRNTLYGWYRKEMLCPHELQTDNIKHDKKEKTNDLSKSQVINLLRENEMLRRECELLRELNALSVLKEGSASSSNTW